MNCSSARVPFSSLCVRVCVSLVQWCRVECRRESGSLALLLRSGEISRYVRAAHSNGLQKREGREREGIEMRLRG